MDSEKAEALRDLLNAIKDINYAQEVFLSPVTVAAMKNAVTALEKAIAWEVG